jgi:hypothetical protein
MPGISLSSVNLKISNQIVSHSRSSWCNLQRSRCVFRWVTGWVCARWFDRVVRVGPSGCEGNLVCTFYYPTYIHILCTLFRTSASMVMRWTSTQGHSKDWDESARQKSEESKRSSRVFYSYGKLCGEQGGNEADRRTKDGYQWSS